jgi:hypothetical protein
VNLSKPFAAIAALGIVEAVYHASNEGAFVTNYAAVAFSPYASLLGVPYWVFGVVWFPLVFVVVLLTSRMGRVGLGKEMLLLLTVGNVFTVYLWYLDFVVINAFTALYAALYATNYALTALVVLENWSSDVMHGYVYGTATGAVVGLLFGPYGVAACGIGGGIFGALRNYAVPIRTPTVPRPSQTAST